MFALARYRSVDRKDVNEKYQVRPRWDSNRLLPENDKGALYPIDATDDIHWNGKIDPSQWAGLVKKCQTKSLRQVAKEYGVSHEAVRRTLKAER